MQEVKCDKMWIIKHFKLVLIIVNLNDLFLAKNLGKIQKLTIQFSYKNWSDVISIGNLMHIIQLKHKQLISYKITLVIFCYSEAPPDIRESERE